MIRPRIVSLIFRKDLVDAIRDSRVLVSVLLPVLIGVIYNVLFEDEQRTKVTLAYTPSASAIVQQLKEGLPRTIDLQLAEAGDGRDVTARVERDAHLGLVTPEGFADAVRSGDAPRYTLVMRQQPTTGVFNVTLAFDALLRSVAGQRPPAQATVERVVAKTGPPPLINELGLRRYMVLATVVMLVGFIALIVVPIILAEEVERRTIEALTLVARTPEVVLAKALVGLAYAALSLVLLLAVTRVAPANVPLFAAALAAISVAAVGFGLLLGGIFRTASRAYTWSGFFLLPIVMPAFALIADVPDGARPVLEAQATWQAMKLFVDATAGKPLFGGTAASFAVIGAWALVGYGLLIWRLRRVD